MVLGSKGMHHLTPILTDFFRRSFLIHPATKYTNQWTKQLIKNTKKKHVSHEKNPDLLSMKYWLVNRDPYNGLL